MEVHFHLYIIQFYDAGIIVIRGTEVCLNQGAPDLVDNYVCYSVSTYKIFITSCIFKQTPLGGCFYMRLRLSII